MKKIINGKKYDTNTAEVIADYTNVKAYGDSKYLNETLYRKRTGEFFLYGESGEFGKYAVDCGSNGCSGGEKITPMDYEEAKQWLEEYGDADKYIEVFGDVEE